MNFCYEGAINNLKFVGASSLPLKSSHSSSIERLTIITSTVGATAADTPPVLPPSCPTPNDLSHDSGDEGKLGPFVLDERDEEVGDMCFPILST